MSNKPTHVDVELNDAQLDQVVGGQEVLSLQMMDVGQAEVPNCVSSVSCNSSASCESSASAVVSAAT
ncbi:hypothetical protein SAMN05443572_105335 [Myxococcus fulvus]|uniref:Uncharacterized protein n=1 Tax=Myxococcus fulvus TaxID=33 RepID=A0A511T597_MYXFU|nr:hypothetical protein [Myxococcus fulvus]GEN09077.1 hypothetical protein MFU01_41140 [Myxococcus fulvus]SEU15140.1 hypothetical protein SAMN05443572_105335 [Myxococcus fulvus]